MHAGRSAALALAACALLATRAAGAQSTAQASAVARSEFDRGVAAIDRDAWDEALAHFARAYALLPQPRILLNLAGAQARTGHLVASAESYRRFVHAATEPSLAPLRASAAEALDAVERRTPHARFALAGLHAVDRVTLDGAPLSHDALDIALPLDPGHHTLAVARGTRAVGGASFDLASGASRDVTVTLLALPDPAPRAPRSSNVLASPWFWTATGAGVVAIAVGIVALTFVARATAAQLVTDTFTVPPLMH